MLVYHSLPIQEESYNDSVSERRGVCRGKYLYQFCAWQFERVEDKESEISAFLCVSLLQCILTLRVILYRNTCRLAILCLNRLIHVTTTFRGSELLQWACPILINIEERLLKNVDTK